MGIFAGVVPWEPVLGAGSSLLSAFGSFFSESISAPQDPNLASEDFATQVKAIYNQTRYALDNATTTLMKGEAVNNITLQKMMMGEVWVNQTALTQISTLATQLTIQGDRSTLEVAKES